MTELAITLTLPDALAQEARARGLLTPEAIAQLIRQELQRQQVDALFASADRLAALQGEPPTAAELEAEIAVVRQARGSTDASGA
jgi:transcriptional regulator of nitric oxide reductase